MALREDKSKSALPAITAKLEAGRMENITQEDIRSWVMVQPILPEASGRSWGDKDMTPSFMLCSQEDWAKQCNGWNWKTSSLLCFLLLCLSFSERFLGNREIEWGSCNVKTRMTRAFVLFSFSMTRKLSLSPGIWCPRAQRHFPYFLFSPTFYFFKKNQQSWRFLQLTHVRPSLRLYLFTIFALLHHSIYLSITPSLDLFHTTIG